MHLITNPSDIYYMTGVCSHDPGEIMVLIGPSKPTVFCDARTIGLFDTQKFHGVDRSNWKEEFQKYDTLETDPEVLTVALQEKIQSYGVRLEMKKSPITEQRVIKTNKEIMQLRESQRKNKFVYERISPYLRQGVTEEEIARKIQIFQLEIGATGSSFPPIVAFGENSAIPHHSPTKRKLEPSDIILLDMGLVYDGYCSDMTRMVYQENTSSEAQKIGEMVTGVTHEMIAYIKPGMKVSDIDKKARNILGDYESYFIHSLGHGVGIDIHEAPHVSSKSDEILLPGMIITVEPGIYISGKYGARYEEMCLVTEYGLEIL